MANNTFMADDLIAATLVQLLEVQAYKQDSSSSYKRRHLVWMDCQCLSDARVELLCKIVVSMIGLVVLMCVKLYV